MEYEAFLFQLSMGTGAALFLAYGLLMAFRGAVPHSPSARAAEDLAYWTAAGIFIFWVIYRYNQGALRSFLFLGGILGAVLCRLTVGRLFVAGMEILLRIPVFFVIFLRKRLLFFLEKCRILIYKQKLLRKNVLLGRFWNVKRGSQGEKKQKKEKQKKDSQ